MGELNSQQGQRLLLSAPCPDCLCGPPILLSNVYWELVTVGLNQLGHEADHSPLSSSEVHIFTPISESGCLWALCPYFLCRDKTKYLSFRINLEHTILSSVIRWCMEVHFMISWTYAHRLLIISCKILKTTSIMLKMSELGCKWAAERCRVTALGMQGAIAPLPYMSSCNSA
jgi:hypothetical protein